MITVLSPHTDDAIFSIGGLLSATIEDVLIASPMAGIPTDGAGHRKHTTLCAEHAAACKAIGVRFNNGGFLDDVYADTRVLSGLRRWIVANLAWADELYIPLGIHHPDHVLVSTIATDLLVAAGHLERVNFYEELPYRGLYPDLVKERLRSLALQVGPLELTETTAGVHLKEYAVRYYKSQIDDALVTRLLVPERVWRIAR